MQRHIKLLHRYNETKDATQRLIGIVSASFSRKMPGHGGSGGEGERGARGGRDGAEREVKAKWEWLRIGVEWVSEMR